VVRWKEVERWWREVERKGKEVEVLVRGGEAGEELVLHPGVPHAVLHRIASISRKYNKLKGIGRGGGGRWRRRREGVHDEVKPAFLRAGREGGGGEGGGGRRRRDEGERRKILAPESNIKQ